MGVHMPLILNSRLCGSVRIIQCQGRIAMGEEARALEVALAETTRGSTKMVINMKEVDRLDSTGIGMLVRHALNLRKRGGDIRLAAPPAFVVTLLKLANLSSVLQAHATEEDAILSFLKQRIEPKVESRPSSRVLFYGSSGDLCVFVKAVLDQHGFEVRSTNNFGDAKILLRADAVDFILVGPCTPQLSAEMALQSLQPLAPTAAALRLDADFHSLDAHEATEALLRLFNSTTKP